MLQQSQRLRREPNSHNAAKPRREALLLLGLCSLPSLQGAKRHAVPWRWPQTRGTATAPALPYPVKRSPRPSETTTSEPHPRAEQWSKLVLFAPGRILSLFARSETRRVWATRRFWRSIAQRPGSQMSVLPNPSLEPIRYGKHCKAGLRYSVHCLSPALQCLPPLSSQLER